MTETNIEIEGMSRQYCAMVVKKTFDALQGIGKAEASREGCREI